MRPTRVHEFRDTHGRAFRVPQFGEGKDTTWVVRHGFGVSTRDYEPFAAALADSTNGRAYLIPIPGLGDAPSFGASVTIERLTAWNHAVSTALELPRDTIRIGESFGGGLELEYAAKYPQHVGGVVAIAPNNTPDPIRQGTAISVWAWGRFMSEAIFSPLSALSRGVESTVAAVTDPIGLGALVKVASGLNTQNAGATIARHQVPALLIRGDSDHVATHEKAQEQAAAMGAKYKVLPGGHGIAHDATPEVITTLREFASSPAVKERGASNRERVTLSRTRPETAAKKTAAKTTTPAGAGQPSRRAKTADTPTVAGSANAAVTSPAMEPVVTNTSAGNTVTGSPGERVLASPPKTAGPGASRPPHHHNDARHAEPGAAAISGTAKISDTVKTDGTQRGHKSAQRPAGQPGSVLQVPGQPQDPKLLAPPTGHRPDPVRPVARPHTKPLAATAPAVEEPHIHVVSQTKRATPPEGFTR